MKKFGSNLKIDRYRRSHIKVCNPSIPPTHYEFFAQGSSYTTIKKYSYEPGVGDMQLIWESEPLPDLMNASSSPSYIADMVVLQDGTIIALVYGGNDEQFGDPADPASVYKISPGGEILAESVEIHIGGRAGGHYISIDDSETFIYAGLSNYPNFRMAKMDIDLNILVQNQVTSNETNLIPATTSSGRLFAAESNLDANIFELDTNDLSIINTISLHDLDVIEDIARSREICIAVNGDIIIPCSDDTDDRGYIVILDQALNIEKILEGAELGFWIDGGTGTTRVAGTEEGYIAICNTEDNHIYLIDPETEQVLWSRASHDLGTLNQSTPYRLCVDLYGNVVVGTGIGDDPDYVIIWDIDGNPYLNIGLQNDSVAIHYTNWQLA